MILILLIGITLIGVTAALLARAAFMPRARTADVLDQIPSYGYRGRTESEPAGTLRQAFDLLAARLGSLGGRFGSETELKSKLMAAGLYTMTPGKLAGYRVIAAVCVPLAWLWIAVNLGLSPLVALGGFAFAILAGWTIPMSIVNRKARFRTAEVDQELPELIDLLVVTVEAGLGFNGSLQVAAERFQGALGEELRLTLQEQRMGLSSDESLRNLLSRCETPSMRSFVRAILQGESLGVSIGQIMRDLATEMRKRRRQRAEERAQRAPIKILFPLILLIFPAMFIVLLAPAVFAVMEAFSG
jgi:tight adherence protein C